MCAKELFMSLCHSVIYMIQKTDLLCSALLTNSVAVFAHPHYPIAPSSLIYYRITCIGEGNYIRYSFQPNCREASSLPLPTLEATPMFESYKPLA